MPSLVGRPVFSYLPGLGCSDLNAAEARELAREVAGRSYNIRALSAPEGELPPGAPAVLRLDLGAFGHDRTAVWERALSVSARTPVRRAREGGLRACEESGTAAVETFLTLLSASFSRHGAPMMPAALFRGLIDALDARILVVRRPDREPLASLLWLLD